MKVNALMNEVNALMNQVNALMNQVNASMNALMNEAVVQRFSVKKVFLKILQNFRPTACNFIKKETLAQGIFCEFFEIFKNTLNTSGGCFCRLYLTRSYLQSKNVILQMACWKVQVKCK